MMAAAKLSPMGRAALWYARKGWRVFPLHTPTESGGCSCRKATCSSSGKHPRTLKGCTDASTDEARVRDWWSTWPDANVGVATGRGLVVVDIDPGHGGDDALEVLERSIGKLPDTVECLTGGGGRHLYLSTPDGVVVRCSAGVLGSGLDVRGEGGYVVAPPSVHAAGRAYGWEASGRPEEVAVAPAPASWLDRLTTRGLRVVSGGGGQTIPEGGRNETLFSIARGLRARGLGERAVLQALLADNEDRCVPPLDPKEVESIARSACTAAPGLSPEAQALKDAARARREAAEPAAPAAEGDGWKASLSCTQAGAVRGTFGNLCLILRHAEAYRSLAYNEMRLTPELDGAALADAPLGRLREKIERDWGFSPGAENLAQAVLTVADERRYHPVRKYLRGLVWDGTPRIDAVPTEVLHADGTRINVTTVRGWFISAVARAMEPGCKVDTALVLVGDQGWQKSGFFRVLGGTWFSDSAIDLSSKDAYLQLRDAWIYEWPEIEAITGSRHAGTVKAFVTSSVDAFRAPYMRAVERWPRSCVIVGTTNEEKFLNDPTGSRRFWTADVRSAVDLELLAAWRDQLWAEAVALWQGGEGWWLTAEAEVARAEAAEGHRVMDPWEETVEAWLREWIPAPKELLTSKLLLTRALGIEPGQQHTGHANRIGAVLRRLGYRTTTAKVDGRTVRFWSTATVLPGRGDDA